MRILIAVEEDNGLNSKLSNHFGHCPYFAIFDTKTKKLKIIENELDHSNSKLTPVDQIMAYKPDVVFSLGMGQKAIHLFEEKGVKLKTGDLKIVKEIIENFDDLEDLDKGCNH